MTHNYITLDAIALVPLILTLKSNWPKIKKYTKNITLVFLAITCWTYIYMISTNKLWIIFLIMFFIISGFIWGFFKK